MLTAAQARRLTDMGVKNHSEEQLQEILAGIEKAASDGNYTYYGDGILLSDVGHKLKELGYTIYTSFQYNMPEYCVSWRTGD